MNSYVALLCGVNVGGKNRLPMAELRAAASTAGLQHVQTYIQSGNLIFQSPTKSNKALQMLVGDLLQSQFSINTPVMVRRTDELRAIRDANPFKSHTDLGKALQLFVLDSPAEAANLKKIHAIKSESESIDLSDHCFYLLAPDGIGRSKLAANAEKLLGVSTTTRNWRTVNKILDMFP